MPLRRLRQPRAAADGVRATLDDVTAAYRLLLRRAPDLEGFTHYARLVEDGIDLDGLVASFLGSEEYQRRVAAEHALAVVDMGGYAVCVDPREPDFGRGLVETEEYEPRTCAVRYVASCARGRRSSTSAQTSE